MGIGAAVANVAMRWLARNATLATASGVWVSGIPSRSDWSTTRAIKDGYKASYIYYSAASDLADCIRSVPWQLKRQTGKGAELIDKHPLTQMIRYPNDQQPWGALCEAWDIYKSIDGNAYGHVVQIGDRVVVWMLRNDRVQIVADKQGHIDHYAYKVGDGKPEQYAPEEIIHFKFFDPGDDLYGLSPLKAAAGIVDTSNFALDWNRESMSNRARPDGMLSPKASLTEAQHKTWRDQIAKQVSGKKNAHKVIINPFEANFVPFALTPVEMDFIRSFETYEDAVCKVLHIHPEALGKTGATFENKRWAIRAKWEGPVNSRLREMRAVLNMRFHDTFGTAYPAGVGDYYLDYDLSDTPAVLEARREAADEAHKYWQMGVPFDVISQKLDLPFDPIPGGDVGYIPATLLPGTRSIRGKFQQIEGQVEGWVRGINEKVRQRLRAERDVVAGAIADGQIDVDPVVESQAQEWRTLIEATWRAVIEHAGQGVAEELNQALSQTGSTATKAIAALSLDRPESRMEFDPWSAPIQGYVETQVAERVKYVTDATKRYIRAKVRQGLDDGKSMQQIAKEIRGMYDDWDGAYAPPSKQESRRSMVIARTEVHSAFGYGSRAAAGQSNIVQTKQWLDAGDNRVRPSHRDNTAAGPIPFNQPYPNGQMFPGDPAGGAAETIMCRCVETYGTG